MKTVENGQGFLVVGGDSLVGGGLVDALKRRGHRTLATTRREDQISKERVFLDFESDTPFLVPAGVGCVFVVAAATDYGRCETDPLAHRINVDLIPRLVEDLLGQGVYVAFVSTNSVFGGERPWPREDDPHAPGIAYASQKSEGEEKIRSAASRLGALERLAVVRLTKILEPATPPLPAWLDAWKQGEVVTPFADLVFAPMSVRFVGEALATIGEKRASGNLHISGAENVSYVDFAKAFARKLGIAGELIASTTATEKGVNIAFKPRFSGLSMERTTSLTGLEPQPLTDVVSDLTAK